MKKETTKREAHTHRMERRKTTGTERSLLLCYLEPDYLCKSDLKLRVPPKLKKYLRDNWKYDNILSECILQKKWIECTQTVLDA